MVFIYLSLWHRNTVLNSSRCHSPGRAFIRVELKALLGNALSPSLPGALSTDPSHETSRGAAPLSLALPGRAEHRGVAALSPASCCLMPLGSCIFPMPRHLPAELPLCAGPPVPNGCCQRCWVQAGGTGSWVDPGFLGLKPEILMQDSFP